jgi:hypothetical protein
MHPHGRTFFTLALGLAAVTLAGCKKQSSTPQTDTGAAAPASQEFSVSGVEVGKQLGPDKRITSPTTTFGPKDTIYVSVATEGAAPSKTISAKWTFQDGQVIKESTETVAPTGPAATEFHIAKATGWPVGKYKVEISVDGSAAGNKGFEVKK